jgi:predicted AlkP superfamily pyrophosphatase or phosphodiesterase
VGDSWVTCWLRWADGTDQKGNRLLLLSRSRQGYPLGVARILTLAVLALTWACRPAAPGSDTDVPTLAIIVAVDQLRADLLDRYDPLFVAGLRRLLDEGHSFENATHDHASTATGPGHFTLSTGVHPSRHGVIGNSWSELEGGEWRSVYSVEDPSRSILGHPEIEGRSPANNERPGLPDWIVSRDPNSRVVSVSRKDRAAIGLAAQAVGDVYWLDENGEFVTSDFYQSEYPAWITEFNTVTMATVYADTVWESITPPSYLPQTRPDSSRFERGGGASAFPYRAADRVDVGDPSDLNRWRYSYTPFPDRAVVSLAIEAIRQLDMGQRGSVDYLGIALSQTDIVGHRFGPRSREQLDNLLRLDAELGRLLSFLDEAVGPGRWVLALSADHGVLDIPEHLAEEGVDASRLTREHRTQLAEAIGSALEQVASASDAEMAVKESILKLPFVAAAYTFDEVERDHPVDSFAALYANSHSRTRAASLSARVGVYTRLRRNTLQWGSPAASHGSPYYYDRHVPIIFLGATVPAGVSSDRAATVDVAPTLAWLTGVPAPNNLDGNVLEQVMGR